MSEFGDLSEDPDARELPFVRVRTVPLFRAREDGADWLLAEVRPFIGHGVSA